MVGSLLLLLSLLLFSDPAAVPISPLSTTNAPEPGPALDPDFDPDFDPDPEPGPGLGAALGLGLLTMALNTLPTASRPDASRWVSTCEDERGCEREGEKVCERIGDR